MHFARKPVCVTMDLIRIVMLQRVGVLFTNISFVMDTKIVQKAKTKTTPFVNP